MPHVFNSLFNRHPMTEISATEPLSETSVTQHAPLWIWFAGVSFVLFQFSLQLSSGVMIGSMMQEMHFSALMMGLLGSSFYFVYTGMQMPVGILFDRRKARHLLTFNALLCSVGCVLFAHSMHLIGFFTARMMIGLGSSFAFVGLSHLIRQYFPARHFSWIIGFSETLGFLVTTMAVAGMGEWIVHWGWRWVNSIAACIGLLIAALCWKFIPTPSKTTTASPQIIYTTQIISVISTGALWINGLIAGLSFSAVTVFGALWATPFVQVKLSCSMQKSSLLCSTFFIGTALSCLLFGMLPRYFKRKTNMMLCSCILTALNFMILLYAPIESPTVLSFIIFLIGFSCGGYILTYPISNEVASPHAQSFAMGFTNTLAVLIAPLIQPTIGYLLDASSPTGAYTLTHYQNALVILPLAQLFAGLLCILLNRMLKE